MKPILLLLLITMFVPPQRGIAVPEAAATATNANGSSTGTLSEIIPLKSAKAADIAEALNSLSRGTNEPIMRLIEQAAASANLPALGPTRATADVRGNSLLISATRPDLEMIRNLVMKLDVPVTQVLIEVAVFELLSKESKSFRRQSREQQSVVPADYSRNTGVFPNVSTSWATNFIFRTAANASGKNELGFRCVAAIDADLDSMLALLATNNRVRIVMRPRIMTSHATPASHFIGSSKYAITQHGGGPHGCYQPLRTGLTLEVTPFIAADACIDLQIRQAVDEPGETIQIAGVGDVPSTRSIESHTDVKVRNSETLVLGGYQFMPPSENLTETQTSRIKHAPSPASKHRELAILLRVRSLPASGTPQGRNEAGVSKH